MKKIWYLTVAIITLSFILSGCGNENAGKANESTESSGSNESAESERENKNDDNVLESEAKDPLNVQFDGTVTYKNHHLTVEGQTNLPAGASVFVNPMALTSVTLMGTSGPVEIRQDGSFVYKTEIPEEYDYGLNVRIRFRPEDSISESIKKKYGEFGENLKGPFVRLYAIDEKVNKQASTTIYMPLNTEGTATAEIDKPEWKKPDDYGDKNIRIEADINHDKNFVYIEGKTNLTEGSQLDIGVLTPEGSLTSSGDKVRVNPDGSFRVQVENPTHSKSLKNYTVRVKFSPTQYSWDNVVKNYGDKGQNMSGELIEMDSVGEKKAFLKVTLE